MFVLGRKKKSDAAGLLGAGLTAPAFAREVCSIASSNAFSTSWSRDPSCFGSTGFGAGSLLGTGFAGGLGWRFGFLLGLSTLASLTRFAGFRGVLRVGVPGLAGGLYPINSRAAKTVSDTKQAGNKAHSPRGISTLTCLK